MLSLFAQAPTQTSGGFFSAPNLMLFGGIFVIMYFMLIRPQQKQMKQQNAMLATLKKGDEVVLQSGLWGKVHTIEEKVVWLEFSNGTKVKVEKMSIVRRIEAHSVAPADEEK